MTEHDYIKSHKELETKLVGHLERLENQIIEQNRMYAIDTDARRKQFEAIEIRIKPMYEMFSSVSGFNRISVWILKFLAMIGAGILGIYAIIEFFKRIGR